MPEQREHQTVLAAGWPSPFDVTTFNAFHRFNEERDGAAWCPRRQDGNTLHYLRKSPTSKQAVWDLNAAVRAWTQAKKSVKPFSD